MLAVVGCQWIGRREHGVPLLHGFGNKTAAAAAVQVCVELSPARLSVAVVGDVLLSGRLYAEVKAEDSTWLIGVCTHLLILQHNCKGNYCCILHICCCWCANDSI
jgi:hypothetical protein